MPTITRSRLALLALLCAAFAMVFALLGGLTFGFGARTIAILGVVGATFGALAGLEIEPGLFRRAALWQTAFGVAGAVGVAALAHATVTESVSAAVIGGGLGYFAPAWVKHVKTV